MKIFNIILFCTAFFLSENLQAQQPKPVQKKPVKVADQPVFNRKSKLFAVARAVKNEILIRWAPSDEYTWKDCNKYGYVIEKYTIVQNNKVLSKFILHEPKTVIKPKPLEEWETLAGNDDNAAVMAQALYGEDFDVEMKGGGNNNNGTNAVASIINETEKAKQRFTMSMYAADHSFNTAVYGALAFRDDKVKKDEKYFYRIYSKVPAAVRKVDTALIYIGLSDEKPLPKPSDILPEFGDKTVMLRWDFDTYKEYYTSYMVERSSDGGKTFTAVSDQPVTNLNENKSTDIPAGMLYMDSLENNETEYRYRIAGVSIFGDKGPYSNVVKGKGKFILQFTPGIASTEHDADDNYYIKWELDTSFNNYVKEFRVNRSDIIQGPFETVITGLSPETRMAKVDKLSASNYFTVTAVSKSGEEKTSFPYLLQPEDSIPPAVPTGLAANIDSSGVVTLTWSANTEKDLAGYRVFKTNVGGHEMVPLVDSVWRETTFSDTTNLKSLNSNVYYTIRSIDRRWNESADAPIIKVKKPDIIPPSQPVLAGYEILDNGIKVMWVGSSSSDVAVHNLYRKQAGDYSSSGWQLVSAIKDNRIQNITDEKCEQGKTYSYTIVAVDSSGLESQPRQPLTVLFPEKRIQKAIKKLEVQVDRDNRKITLAWEKMPDVKNIRQYELYRGDGDKKMSLYLQLDNTVFGFEDKELQVNTKYRYAVRAIYADGKQSDFITKNVIY
jgi:uncharacterized protein